MAFPITKASWITYVREFIDADEYTDSQILTFLDLAQNRMNKEMVSYGMESVTQVAVTAPMVGIPIDILPLIPDFNKIRLVSVVGIGPLEVAAINEMKKYQEAGDNTGDPCFYTIDAKKLYLYPSIAEGAFIDVFYYKKIPLMSDLVDTNVFTEEYPDTLLHATCLEAAPYMVEDERIPIWENKYTNALIVANTESTQIKMGSTPLRRRIAN